MKWQIRDKKEIAAPGMGQVPKEVLLCLRVFAQKGVSILFFSGIELLKLGK